MDRNSVDSDQKRSILFNFTMLLFAPVINLLLILGGKLNAQALQEDINNRIEEKKQEMRAYGKTKNG